MKRRKPVRELTVRQLGRLGGLARARRLSPERASELGRKASRARWDKQKKTQAA